MSDDGERQLDNEALIGACKKIGLIILSANEKDYQFEENEPGRSAMAQSIAEPILDEARGYVNQLLNRKRDPNTVTRAIEYLAYTHAFARQGASTRIYAAMLEAVMEIALQEVQQPKQNLPFLGEMERGLKYAQKIGPDFERPI